jgi:exopolyphosphatase/guanosine-5'-triphosphate,3'-diphosphate pyrophosphatase
MRLGIIDLGSNSIRLVVYQWDGETLKTLHNVKKISKNLQFIHDAVMSKDGLDHIVSILRELMFLARGYDVETLDIFATASIRNIKNSAQARAYIENEIQSPIDVLEDHEESRLGFEGLKRQIELPLQGISIDIGGGSTEITFFRNNQVIASNSLPIGSLNLYLSHVHDVLPTPSEQFMIRLDVQNHLESLPWLSTLKVDTVIGIGGTARAILRLHQAKYGINTSIFDMQLSRKMVQDYAEFNFNIKDFETRLIMEALPDRFTTVIPGCIILDEVMERVHANEYRISAYGVREGYLYQHILSEKKGT